MSDKNAMCGRKAEAGSVIDLAGGSGDALLIETLLLLAELDQRQRYVAISAMLRAIRLDNERKGK